MAGVRFSAVSKEYQPGDEALVSLTLDVAPGELCALIGPSGCGKTTALRILAGLEDPDEGEVSIDGAVVTNVPTRSRGLGLVTDRNALPPKRTARGAIALPLEVRGVALREIDERIRAEARSLEITALLDRRAKTLSSGEAQIVQVARALVARPRAFLLDEPLARIDPELRRTVRTDIVRLQQRYGVTTLWVTADQEDALSVADRLGVLIDGRLRQIGPPQEIFARPRTLAVAQFVGEPELGAARLPVRGAPGDLWFEFGEEYWVRARTPVAARYVGDKIIVGIRPFDVELTGADGLPCTVEAVEPLGHVTTARLRTVYGQVLTTDRVRPSTRIGDRLQVRLDADRFHLFDPHTEVAIHHPD